MLAVAARPMPVNRAPILAAIGADTFVAPNARSPMAGEATMNVWNRPEQTALVADCKRHTRNSS